MKKLRASLYLQILIVFISFNSSIAQTKHIGEWKGTDDTGETAAIILEGTNHAVFVGASGTLGGNDFEINGKKAECRYEIDYSKNPIWLDFIIYEKGTAGEKERLKGILRFISNTKIELRLNFSGKRHLTFDKKDKENTIILEKVNK